MYILYIGLYFLRIRATDAGIANYIAEVDKSENSLTLYADFKAMNQDLIVFFCSFHYAKRDSLIITSSEGVGI